MSRKNSQDMWRALVSEGLADSPTDTINSLSHAIRKEREWGGGSERAIGETMASLTHLPPSTAQKMRRHRVAVPRDFESCMDRTI